jgi:hypothetical protein
MGGHVAIGAAMDHIAQEIAWKRRVAQMLKRHATSISLARDRERLLLFADDLERQVDQLEKLNCQGWEPAVVARLEMENPGRRRTRSRSSRPLFRRLRTGVEPRPDDSRKVDREAVATLLERVEKRVQRGEDIVNGQRQLVARLKADGHRVELACVLLKTFEAIHALHLMSRSRLREIAGHGSVD